ncbi:3-dehydroquinate synthase [Paucilactobacillus suebicus]|uniref:3-dehydroquinate synthase n=1 Tax=Paucilactobacillus suebicus DSM 5007 = KCTC 3549 TaxID=1423807 RepID=A0A0R1W489_9LACO|nr:3-dehydroquinate synthase [Paucilactobacillus suebicus]KRM10211.1 3-dehydroquinate synthase [Paucilactobacillus suebicus DSM 5007 = KCTC 3549]
MAKVEVNLPQTKYTVLIEEGLLDRVGSLIGKQWSSRKIALITDTNVGPLYQQQVVDQLTSQGFTVCDYVVKAGEASKAWPVVADLATKMAADHFTRSDGVIALGGGVVGDLAGFTASIYMRGISFIQIPTSLLAQVDSSVGGKTAIDLGEAKNIIGTFYQPDAVYIDPLTLKTMTDRYVAEGYGEIVKTAALDSQDFWHLIQQINSVDDIRAHATELSQRSIGYKARIVMEDEKEAGNRQLLNFGHTMGHAIELLAHGDLAHGEAVSVGMVHIMQVFEDLGLARIGITAEIKDRVSVVGLPTESALLGTPDFYEKIKNDKKNKNGTLNLVYVEDYGKPHIHGIPTDSVKEFFKE